MAYVRLDKIKATAHIESVVHSADLKNGQFLELGVIDETLGGEAVDVEMSTVDTKPEAILVTPHLDYGEINFDYAKQVTKAGKMGRAYILEAGNTLSFSADLVAGEPAVGDMVTVGESGLGIKKVTDSEVAIGKVIGTEYLANIGDLTVVRFK